MLKPLLLAASLSAALSPVCAQTQTNVPGWQDLENAYAQDGNIDRARRQLTNALPAGTPSEQAVAALLAAGATCKPDRAVLGGQRCLIHQYSLADGAADDVRWTVHLGTQASRVSAVSLDRSVDRHGTN